MIKGTKIKKRGLEEKMISYKEFEILVDLLKTSYSECRCFNKALEKVYGEDTSVWYYKQYEIVCEHFIKILELNGESKDGAEWFVYEGLEQIEKGGTKIEFNGKIYDIKDLHGYYDYLIKINSNYEKDSTQN